MRTPAEPAAAPAPKEPTAESAGGSTHILAPAAETGTDTSATPPKDTQTDEAPIRKSKSRFIPR